jgi:putative ABC transport system permease protein
MFWENVYIALQGLFANKMRSALTMLGIIIGVGAVIAMVSIGAGARAKVSAQIASLGSNLLVVSPGAVAPNGMRLSAGSTTTLTMLDAKAVERESTAVRTIAPMVSRQYQVVFGNQNWQTNVIGSTPELAVVRDYRIEQGNFFSTQDLDTRARVVVLGRTVADNLFGGTDAVGQVIRINKSPFRVTGVLASKGQSATGSDQDDTVLIPITTAQERLMGLKYIQNLYIQALDDKSVDFAQEEVTSILRKRHHLEPGAPDDFSVRNLQAVMATAEETTQTITVLLGSIAAISLVVGGIGIMNIMLVSVTERTREIGIRKAIGAKKQDILLQFMVESMVISILGGVIGILVGVVGAWLISALAGWDTLISFGSVSVAFCFSMAIGVFFGIYPAQKAAALDPIDALRYE